MCDWEVAIAHAQLEFLSGHSQNLKIDHECSLVDRTNVTCELFAVIQWLFQDLSGVAYRCLQLFNGYSMTQVGSLTDVYWVCH